MIKRAFSILAFLTASLYAVQAQTPGNPENWCRNGAFPTDSQDFKIGKVKSGAKAAKRVYFYNDYEDDCPTNEKCREKYYRLDQTRRSRYLRGEQATLAQVVAWHLGICRKQHFVHSK
jgi:hypothetical protein